MRAIKRHPTTPSFVPDYIAKSISDIDFEKLAEEGVKYIAFDADSTLVPFRGIKIAPSTVKLLLSKRKLFKDWCIASNRLPRDLYDTAASINAGIVQAGLKVRKPQRRFFARVMRHLGVTKPDEIAMVGDKVLADIWGGNRAGFVTVWVEHLGSDNPWDRLIRLRQLEKRVLKRYIDD